jgi:hypothetical protein
MGLLPVWVIGETPLQTGYNERFALPAMFGLALFWVAMLWNFIENESKRRLVLSVMLGLAIAGHLRVANTFRLDWQKQEAYFSQIAWRAPSIKPDTAFVFFGPLTDFMPTSSTSAALNTLYTQSRQEQKVDFWYFDLQLSANVRVLEGGESFANNYRGIQFDAEDSGSNLFFYQNEDGCLWLLSPLHSQNAYIPQDMRQFAASSDPSRIIADKTTITDSPIFKRSSNESWCNYYQNAERLSQLGEWQEIVSLMQEAQRKNLNPNLAIEWLPLVRAHAQLGDWRAAEEISQKIHQSHARNDAMLCSMWNELSIKNNLDKIGNESLAMINELASCQIE